MTLAQLEQNPKDENGGKVQLPVAQTGLLSGIDLLFKTALPITANQS